MKHREFFYIHDINYDRMIEIDIFSKNELKASQNLNVFLTQITVFD